MTAEAQLTLPAQTLSREDPAIRRVLEKAKRQVGFIPSLYANIVNSPGVLVT